MSKSYKFVDQDTPDQSQELCSLDWTKCVLCQKEKSEPLQCPAEIRRTNVELGVGYQSLETCIERFNDLGCLPMPLNLKLFDEGNGIAYTLNAHRAKWHKNCRNKLSNLKLQRAEKRQSPDDEHNKPSGSKITRKSSGSSASNVREGCFFCGESTGDLHQASTFNINKRVRKCAIELQDTVLLAKLSVGDLMSQEAIYHSKCLIALYNKASRVHPKTDEKQTDKIKRIQGIVLAELVSFIEETRVESDTIAPVFMLADLVQMYDSRVNQLVEEDVSHVHRTDLKNRILANIPDIQAYKQGRNILLAFNKDIGFALKQMCENDFDDEGLILARAASIVRRDMLNIKSVFNGTFERNCQQDSVPQSLVTLVGMILGGPNIQTQSGNIIETQSALSISQLLQFSCTIRRRTESTGTRHLNYREPPLPIYLGLLVHAETRKRGLVDKLYDLGLSVSYDRVLAMSTELGNTACARFEAEKVVCPSILRKGIFTTSAVDNIDHNPSSTTAQGALHGTGISLFQHPSTTFSGEDRTRPDSEIGVPKSKVLARLPEAYTDVPAVVLRQKEPERARNTNVTGPFC